ncbi:MAG: metallophosphoesterase [Planctomycetaceae bacterium]|nr:metallophosphoesterase [Planctomycetaceae bacterium]
MTWENSISGPVAVIGDVHGQVDQLARILEQLRQTPNFERRWIVFIGDLVDRGSDPKGAIDLMCDLLIHHPRTTVVSGNHELAMGAALHLVDTPEYSDWSGRWIDHYGSEATFQSYGCEMGDLEALREAMPEDHRRFLADVPWCVEHPDFFFVHAGLDPNSSFEVQREILRARDFTLNRPQWLCSKSLPFEDPPKDCTHVVVSGHVKVPQVKLGRRRILTDTTGGEGGSLSCVLLPEGKVIHSDPSLAREPAIVGHEQRPKSVPKKKGWFW